MAEIISRQHLNKLRGKDFVKESETFDYKEFIAWHSKKLNDANDMESVWPYVKQHLKPLCPPIELVGVGSSRAAFALKGGKCLKVAINMHGFSQNETEVEISKNSEQFSCFTKVYSYDWKTNGSILTECCSEAKDADFMQHFGCTDESVIHMLQCLIENEGDLHRAQQQVI